MRIIIFDTETTGLPNASDDLLTQPYLCQFGAITIDYNSESGAFTEVDRMDVLIKPAIPMPLTATHIHGITDEMLAEAPSFADVAERIIEAFQTVDVAVAHNLAFDQRIIEIELARVGRSKQFLPPQTIDTMNEGREMCAIPGKNGNFRAPRLMDLYQYFFNERFDRAHNALNDVLATSRCLEELLKRGVVTPQEPVQDTLF